MKATVEDVFSVQVQENDVVYLDPPYTKRQYASYYHILETIALNDEPEVQGVCGLRPWKEKASPFCYKRRALSALINLIEQLPANCILLSYSDEGHVDLGALADALAVNGKLDVIPLKEIGRYRPNKTASANGSAVKEYLIRYTRNTRSSTNRKKEKNDELSVPIRRKVAQCTA